MSKIMIVDDNRQNRMVASGFLEDDYTLLVVESGEACLEKIAGFEPDLILLDWMMPGLDGLEVLEKIREQVAFRNIRIVMFTAKAQPKDITRAWRAGANDYIPKPFEMEELISVVERQVAEKHRLDDLDAKWRELEDGIRQAQKMEALGSLAGGIAHDFNNILFPIQAFAELLSDHPDPEVAEDANEIRNAAHRAGRLVGQILSFSRQSRQPIQPVAMNLIVKEALKLIKASFPSNIKIRSVITPECGIVIADPTSIHQVVMNLCTNAKHAMDEAGGVMTVTLGDYCPETAANGLEPGSIYLELAVSDDGCGIPPDIQGKIFKPFFTTKPAGKGTGMGLSVVNGIVRELGGAVTVESRVGDGSTFRVYLPVRYDECVLPDDAEQEVIGGNEHVMVVDDEPAIADMLEKILGALGYRVCAFTDPDKALEAISNDVDLLITDMTMPGMSGLVLTEKAWEKKNDLPVILLTGFSEAIDPDHAGEMGVCELLFKPVGRSDIAAAIRKALDERNNGMLRRG
ncbi:MAG: response regulator [Desulfobacter sp.]